MNHFLQDNQVLDNSLNIYNRLLAEASKRLLDNKYLIEFNKCCGYQFFLFIHKQATLADIFNEVAADTQNTGFTRLFVESVEDGSRVELYPYTTVAFRDYIRDHPAFFRPVYPIPAKVVYKIIYDDGHIH
jgi:hypothetical protein